MTKTMSREFQAAQEALKLAEYLGVNLNDLKPWKRTRFAELLERIHADGYHQGQNHAYARLGVNLVFALGNIEDVVEALRRSERE